MNKIIKSTPNHSQPFRPNTSLNKQDNQTNGVM